MVIIKVLTIWHFFHANHAGAVLEVERLSIRLPIARVHGGRKNLLLFSQFYDTNNGWWEWPFS